MTETMESTVMSYLIYCTTAVIISFSLFYAYAKYKLSYWRRRGVKSLPTHWLFGNFKDVLMMRKQPNDLMFELYNKSDPDDLYVGFYIFHKPLLLIKDHNLIKELMIKKFDIFPNRRFGSTNGMDTMGLSNLLAITSPSAWKYLRNKLTPALTGQRLRNTVPLIIDRGESMLNYIDELPMNAAGCKTIDSILSLSSRCVNDILTCLFFGVYTNSFDKEKDDFWQMGEIFCYYHLLQELVKNRRDRFLSFCLSHPYSFYAINQALFYFMIIDMTCENICTNVFRGSLHNLVFIIYFFIPELIPIIKPFIMWKNVDFFRKCFRNSMENREKTKVKIGDLIDFLLTLKNEEQNPIFKFEGDNLLAQAVAFYIAGFEATGSSIGNVLFYLACREDYQITLYNEINEHLSGKKINIELLNELSFLDSVVNESLRIHPPIPVVDRIAENDFKLSSSGLVIEKGVPIYVSVSGTNQDSKYFSDPLEFNPYRAQLENKRFYESLAFGIGPRACIGQRLAIIIMKLIIIMIISHYEVSCEEKKNKMFIHHLFSYDSEKFSFNFKRRDKSAQA